MLNECYFVDQYQLINSFLLIIITHSSYYILLFAMLLLGGSRSDSNERVTSTNSLLEVFNPMK